MARGATLFGKNDFLVGEASRLDRRGWKASPTENNPIYLKGFDCSERLAPA
jgi:hypothetical protein